ncbi:hypothetical protein BST55_22545 [Vibrio vulnificus]|uniref:hypothetical protein n=1 Tax=Vibrio vulnificus TaxID=672 RepID=UPI000BA176E0|nr:hypothetical protein [Vibrio vulnificus]EGR8992406.1 hypothetical protein [Vibrio vulnificus]MCU8566769.1 hypothetical protein [Vibrio vulnificus]OZS51058.1 hypothetical protein BST51_22340 [Vibrio vulnificus]OZS55624.1 hypothetical protein BST52_22625 [Vibrio vulnificus]OZS60346.1 hypothetical protein BST56_22200 [Vibrio vulnificus]
MPNKEFIEEFPLYRKFEISALPSSLDRLPKVNINMGCPSCKSSQTFTMRNEYHDGFGYVNYPSKGAGVRLAYVCSHCNSFERLFFVKLADDGKWMMKVGQYPAWEIAGEPNVERLLGKHRSYYKKGLICESQGYGVAAFAYYRRIVEEIIDELLSEIALLLSPAELSDYNVALEKTKQTLVTAEKIELVKDLLPAILRPEGMNPLSALHSALSEGLHAESDQECLEFAEHCREVLVFLVNQVAASKEAAKSFTTSMRKLLDKKTAKNS